MVDLIRNDPWIALELLRDRAGVKTPAGATVHISESFLDQLAPPEHRADLVLEVRASTERSRMVIVLEVQLARDGDKRFVWPVHLAIARARHRCDALLLVLTPNAEIARWAGEPIDVGGGNVWVPCVVGPASIPVIVDTQVARRRPHLSVLSAIAHGNHPERITTVLAALAGVGTLHVDTQRPYDSVIQNALDESARRALLEMIMQGVSIDELPLPEYVRRLIAQGEVRGGAQALLRVFATRGFAVPEELRIRVLACEDATTLERCLVRAVRAPTLEEVFQD